MNRLPQLSLALPLGNEEAYLYAVNQIPLLTHEEELELAQRYKNEDDLEAARRLVMSHLRFVVRIAQGYNGYGLGLMDLVQEGNIGLMKAVRRFDPMHGVRLVSFAVHWIKAEMHEFIIKNWRIVKIATTKAQRKLFFNLRSMKKNLGFTAAEVKDIAQQLGVSERDVMQMDTRLYGKDVSLEIPNDEQDENTISPIHYLEDKRYDPAMLIEQNDWLDQGGEGLLSAIDELDERSKHILKARWLDENKMTLQDLANYYSVSPERVRQIEKNAMNKLKAVLQAYAN